MTDDLTPGWPGEVLRAADRAATPWRNGAGLTREVARGATDPVTGDFDWRVSVAEVAAPGPFSTFEGVQRIIVLIDGDSMTLTIDGVEQVLGLYQPLTFDGASRTSCALPAGPTRDLNVMTTTGRARADVEIVRPAAGAPTLLAPADALLLVVLTGHVKAAGPQGETVALGELDAVRWAASGPLRLSGAGVVAVVRLSSAGR